MRGDEQKCYDAGMNYYLSKPVMLSDLQSALEHWRPTVEALRGVA
jgi:CheY-like chemotaxis protein